MRVGCTHYICARGGGGGRTQVLEHVVRTGEMAKENTHIQHTTREIVVTQATATTMAMILPVTSTLKMNMEEKWRLCASTYRKFDNMQPAPVAIEKKKYVRKKWRNE